MNHSYWNLDRAAFRNMVESMGERFYQGREGLKDVVILREDFTTEYAKGELPVDGDELDRIKWLQAVTYLKVTLNTFFLEKGYPCMLENTARVGCENGKGLILRVGGDVPYREKVWRINQFISLAQRVRDTAEAMIPVFPHHKTKIKQFGDVMGDQLLYQVLGLVDTEFPKSRRLEKDELKAKIKNLLPGPEDNGEK